MNLISNLQYYSGLLYIFSIISSFSLIILFITFLVIRNRLFPPKKQLCAICKKTKPDLLAYNGQYEQLCREHLLPKYKMLFTQNTFKHVLIEFTDDFNDSGDITYTYYPLSTLNTYENLLPYKQVLTQLINSINRDCQICGKRSLILFIRKENAVWEKKHYGRNTYSYIVPTEKYLTTGQYLCNEDAFSNIEESLKLYPKPIDTEGGIWLPYKDNGFQTSVLV